MAGHSSLWAAPRMTNLRALSCLLGKAGTPSRNAFCHLNSFARRRFLQCSALPFVAATRATSFHCAGRLRMRCFNTIATQQAEAQRNHQAEAPSVNVNAVVPTFQQAIQRLQEYWATVGCAVMQSSNTEVGAGTMNPSTFLRVLGPEPWNVAYVEPSIRPDDSRYGDNPNRLQRHTQFQVILKPDPGNSQELYLGSLAALGIDINIHDVRFVEDNWESPVLGAWGLGWEVWLNGMEITQFTYFQQAGSMPLMPISVEITYGLERILMAVQSVDHFRKIQYAPGITYGELFLENEKEMCTFYLDFATVERVQQQFDLYDAEARALLDKRLAIPAYDHVLKASHAFNILDARGAIGVTERARFFGRMRRLARDCAQLWVKTREQLDHPLGLWKRPPTVQYPSEAVSEAAQKVISTRHFVLEIGSEELPSHDVINALDQIHDAIHLFLQKRRLVHGCVSIFGTPRRLVVQIEDLAPMQDDIVKDVRGPPSQKSFDEDGMPTKALEGFCKKNGVNKDNIFIRADGKTEYVFATVKDQGKHAIQVLSEDLPGIIGGISFGRTMRWNSEASYSRPIRWLLAIYGDMVVPFSYADVLSGRATRALRNSPTPVVQVGRAEDYVEYMKSAGIVLSMEERRNVIWKKCSDLANIIGGRIPEEAHGSLLDEVTNLVESPSPLLGSFDECFLELPADVLTTVMRKHQRYFPVQEPGSGRLLPAFIAVANGKVDQATVRKGNEAVLRARCEDAKFFYESDISKPLALFRPQLKGILFQEKLGSMFDKSIRIEKIIGDLGMLIGLDEGSISTAQKAAPLATADLATNLVTEFTSLAGIMGRHYALKEGQPLSVAQAIFESVLPRYAGDKLPSSQAGILLAIADRLDSLVGLFSVGCQPSASADPFGLRRSASGLVQALVENEMTMEMNKALSIAASIQPVPVSESTVTEVLTFITRRLEQLLIDRGANVEIVRAALSERGNNPMLATQSVKQLEHLSKGDDLKKIIVAYSRSAKLARPELVDSSWMVNKEYFEQPEEEALWIAYKQISSQLTPGIAVDKFVEASLKLVEPLDRFLDNVFVLVEDKNIQKNRLALLRKIIELPKGIVDLSVLPGF